MNENAPARILLVDDEQAVLTSHSMILERQGYSVLTAATSEHAIELAGEADFDLLICDLSLDRGASGLDVIKVALQRNATLPIILLTGYSDTDVPAEYSAYRIKVVSKPAMIPDLLEAVRSMLTSGHHACKQSAE